MGSRYTAFRKELPSLTDQIHLNVDELTFSDYLGQIEEWLKKNAQAPK
jgi:hypothetical protein